MTINKGKIVAEDSPERLQSRMAGAQRVLLTVGGDADGLETLVGQVSGVSRVGVGLNSGLEIDVDPGKDARAEIARAVVNAGYDLLELRPQGVSLEDIFLQLTRDEPAPPEPTDSDVVETELDIA